LRHRAALLLWLAASPAPALADPVAEAQAALAAHRAAAAEARAQARQAAAQAAELSEQQVAAAAALRKLEDETGADGAALASLQAQQHQATARLQTAEAALETLLPVMQRLAAQPDATLLATPESPSDAVRAMAIIQGIARRIAAEAANVRTANQRLGALSAETIAAQAQLTAAAAAQQAAEANLSDEIRAAQAAEMRAADHAAREAEASLAAQRKLISITAAVARLVPDARAPALPEGAGGAPVAGHVIQNFGDATLAGPAAGVSYTAVPGARVVTPCAGTVMFAGAFPAYGQMVIADCGRGTSIILAGMASLDVETGELLAHGQPVGLMAGSHSPTLYVELRQNGTPVDPARWLAAGHSG